MDHGHHCLFYPLTFPLTQTNLTNRRTARRARLPSPPPSILAPPATAPPLPRPAPGRRHRLSLGSLPIPRTLRTLNTRPARPVRATVQPSTPSPQTPRRLSSLRPQASP